MQGLSNNKQTDLVVMDFAKAFDKVEHSSLCHKLARYGVQQCNRWILNYLSDRSQKVLVEGERSDSVGVTSGVPQGSVLGPCLFLFYINDLLDGLKSRVRLFADNTIKSLLEREG